jgi:hypothetical protein
MQQHLPLIAHSIAHLSLSGRLLSVWSLPFSRSFPLAPETWRHVHFVTPSSRLSTYVELHWSICWTSTSRQSAHFTQSQPTGIHLQQDEGSKTSSVQDKAGQRDMPTAALFHVDSGGHVAARRLAQDADSGQAGRRQGDDLRQDTQGESVDAIHKAAWKLVDEPAK